MLQRFYGQDRLTHLVEALEIQPIVNGDTAIAEAISGFVEVESFEPGSGIIEESAPDNDLYFILAGIVSIRVSGREIAARTAGQHVGEMALLDPGRPRSACAVAAGEVVVARIAAAAFTMLADANPRMWRNVARSVGRAPATARQVRVARQPAPGYVRGVFIRIPVHCPGRPVCA